MKLSQASMRAALLAALLVMTTIHLTHAATTNDDGDDTSDVVSLPSASPYDPGYNVANNNANPPDSPQPAYNRTISTLWNGVALSCIRIAGLPPTVNSRALMMTHTAIFDAFAAYSKPKDYSGVWYTSKAPLSLTSATTAAANQLRSMEAAAWSTITKIFTQAVVTAVNPNASLSAPPDGTDNAWVFGVNVATAQLNGRSSDGLTTVVPINYNNGIISCTSAGVCANPPTNNNDSTAPFPSLWQPLAPPLVTVTPRQAFATPQWSQMLPFALDSGDQFVANPPSTWENDQKAYVRQAIQLLNISAALDNRTKYSAEYWADGPKSETPPGHWTLLATFVSQRDNNSIEDDVVMFFLMTGAVYDAGIAAWNAKLSFNSVRPIGAIRYLGQTLWAGQTVKAWGGPCKGTIDVDPKLWIPYQAPGFVTPAFPEHVSGHSTFSSAAAHILKKLTKSDNLGFTVTLPGPLHENSIVEPACNPGTVRFTWDTFTDAALDAGISRLFGGIHFQNGNVQGRKLGIQVAKNAWKVANKKYIKPTGNNRQS